MVVVVSWLALVVGASAGPAGPFDAGGPAPPPIEEVAITDIEGWTLTRYNDTLVEIQFEAVRGILGAQRRAMESDPTPDHIARFHREVRKYLADAEAASARIPPWEGDATLRDGLHESFVWLLGAWDRDVDEMFRLLLATEVHNADLARLEELNRAVEDGAAAADERLQRVHAAFAERHDFVLVRSDAEPQPPPEEPEFSAPGIPPAGSRLPASVHVNLAATYENAAVASWNRVIEALNGFLDATGVSPAAAESARTRALRAIGDEVRRARAMEDWQGDAALRDAIVGAGERVEALLAGPFAESLAIGTKKAITQAQADRANALVDEGNAGLRAVSTDLAAAQAGFRARWGIEAMLAWQAAHPEAAPAPETTGAGPP